ncbi:MAG: transketolase C-terminal domain-containing protein, partial [Ferruginibacter sp.]
FFQVDTYRLNPHSKGDDDRHADEIYTFRQKDYLEMFSKNEEAYYNKYQDSIVQQVNEMVEEILLEPETDLTDYYKPTALKLNLDWNTIEPIAKRQVELINDFFRKEISANDKLVFIGEDVLSPYGGAFKVARDLSDIAPERVFSTPISEAAIMGISNGLALNGFKPFAEIMFGDFITLAFDQIVNHASKFHHMFNKQVNCPVVVRTPMGGRRGYGPTHSQTLDKFLVGIDNVKTIALNTFIDPTEIFKSIVQEEHPVILIENKIDYGKKILNHPAQNYKYQKNSDSYPVVRVSPTVSLPSLTIVAYGGMADIINTFLINIFIETNLLVELIIPTLISDLPIELISKSVEQTGKLVVIEEGSAYAGIGSELIAGLNELGVNFKGKRIAALPVPIPSAKSLEHAVLPGLERIIEEIKKTYGSSANN